MVDEKKQVSNSNNDENVITGLLSVCLKKMMFKLKLAQCAVAPIYQASSKCLEKPASVYSCGQVDLYLTLL